MAPGLLDDEKDDDVLRDADIERAGAFTSYPGERFLQKSNDGLWRDSVTGEVVNIESYLEDNEDEE